VNSTDEGVQCRVHAALFQAWPDTQLMNSAFTWMANLLSRAAKYEQRVIVMLTESAQ
jgi:hypothetical protein